MVSRDEFSLVPLRALRSGGRSSSHTSSGDPTWEPFVGFLGGLVLGGYCGFPNVLYRFYKIPGSDFIEFDGVLRNDPA